MKNVEKIKTLHCLFSILFPKIVPFMRMLENRVESDRSQMTIRRMRFTCWITKATDTHSEHVILIAFPHQHWLREHASVLRYTYSASPFRFMHTCPTHIKPRTVYLLQSAADTELPNTSSNVCSTRNIHFPQMLLHLQCATRRFTAENR